MLKLGCFSRYSSITKPVILGSQQCFLSQEKNTEWANAKPLKEMPGYGKWEFFRAFMPGGKFHAKDFAYILNGVRQDFGDLAYVPSLLGQPERVISFHPDDFEIIFRNEGVWPVRLGFEVMRRHRLQRRKDYYENTIGLLVANGEGWGKFRSSVNPVLMQPKNAKNYLGRMSKITDEFVERIKIIRDPNLNEMPANFLDEMHRYILESVAIVALDKQLGLINGQGKYIEEANEFFKHIKVFVEAFTDLEVRPPIWKIVETPLYKKVTNSLDHITDFVDKHIKESIERLEASGATEKPDDEKSVLEKLLKIDKKIAKVMAIDMFSAGIDTTASALTGILLCLAQFPEKQAKLREEVLQILPEKQSQLTPENTQHLPYLRACAKEALRFYPVAPGSLRCMTKDIVLKGYRIPKGTEISMINDHLLRNVKYFANPDEFIPERWLRNSVEANKNTHPFAYFPFGFGSRSCVGKRIAELELEVAVMKIVRNFNVKFNYPTENIFHNRLINVPARPLKFEFTDL